MPEPQVGTLLRDWRRRRNLSQLDLAGRAGVSSRHLSFVETGRSRPSKEMILRLCDELDVPPREQNTVLLANGLAPTHREVRLGEPPLAQVAAAIEHVLAGQLPYPALVIDRGWDLVSANDAVYALLDGVAPRLLEPPVNVIRLTLDPDGLAPRIVNLGQWRAHLIGRLRRELDHCGDERLRVLLAEIGGPGRLDHAPELIVPFKIRAGDHVLAFLSTTTVFGTANEVTSSELAIEAFYPADDATRRLLLGGSG